jgi:hypothetical protein
MDVILEKIKKNNELINSLTEDNIKLISVKNLIDSLTDKNTALLSALKTVGGKITVSDCLYTFTLPNLQEFIEKFKLVIDGRLLQNYYELFRGNGGTIHRDDKWGMMMPSEGYFALRGIGKRSYSGGYKLENYANTDKLDLYVRFEDDKLILYDEYVMSTFRGRNIKFDYNTLQQTSDNPDIYSYECSSLNERLMVCPLGEKGADKCDCFFKSAGKREVIETIKCTHACTCSDGQYPYQCWRPKFKYTVNIATREIHLYIDFE